MTHQSGVIAVTVAAAALVGVLVALGPGGGDAGSLTIPSNDRSDRAGQASDHTDTWPSGGSQTTSPEPSSTTVPAVVTSPPTTVASITVPPTTAQRVTSPPTTTLRPVLDRSEVIVVVANGTNFPGVAGRTAAGLEDLGYVDVAAVDADPVGQTVVYHLDGFDREARRIVEDLGLAPVALPIRPIDLAPAVTPIATADVLVLIGSDQV